MEDMDHALRDSTTTYDMPDKIGFKEGDLRAYHRYYERIILQSTAI